MHSQHETKSVSACHWPVSRSLVTCCKFPLLLITFSPGDFPLQWRHNECYGVSNHQHLDCLLSHLFRRTSKKTPKLRVIGLCEGTTPVTSEFPAQRASNAEVVSIYIRANSSCGNRRTRVISCGQKRSSRCPYALVWFLLPSPHDTFNSPWSLALCDGNPSLTGGFTSQSVSYMREVFPRNDVIPWRLLPLIGT